MIEYKVLLLTCFEKDPRRRGTVTIKTCLYIHKRAVIRTTNLKQIFYILIDVEPKNKVGLLLKFVNKS